MTTTATTTTMNVCHICFDDKSQITGLLKCESCSLRVCGLCIVRRFEKTCTEQSSIECMQCKTLMHKNAMLSVMTPTCVKRYKRAYASLLYKKQELFFPSTMQYVKYYKMIKATRESMSVMYKYMNVLSNKIQCHISLYGPIGGTASSSTPRSNEEIVDQSREACHYAAILAATFQKTRTMRNVVDVLTETVNGHVLFEDVDAYMLDPMLWENTDASQEIVHTRYVDKESVLLKFHTENNKLRLCVVPCDKCDGSFVYENETVCAVCGRVLCRKCNTTVDDIQNHVCDETQLSTLKLVRESTKPCPTCAVPIQKTDGCNDMFCTYCKTTFHWITMKVNYNGNSNPMYIAYVNHGYDKEKLDKAAYMLDMMLQAIDIVDDITTIGHDDDTDWKMDYENSTTATISAIKRMKRVLYMTDRVLNQEDMRNMTRIMRLQYVCGDIHQSVFKQKLMNMYERNERVRTHNAGAMFVAERLPSIFWERFVNVVMAKSASYKKDESCFTKPEIRAMTRDVVMLRHEMEQVLGNVCACV